MDVSRDMLLNAAAEAAQFAYAPYSSFRVGAAILTADGEIITGCNVENASYGLTICAERNAVFAAVAAGRRAFTAMAIVSDGAARPYPCGACRQVLTEFCDAMFPVSVAGIDDLASAETFTLDELLPHRFTL